MATSRCWFLALLVVAIATSCFLAPAVAGRGAAGGHEGGDQSRGPYIRRRRSLVEMEQEKPAQVDVAVAVSALSERRLEDSREYKLQGEVTASTGKARGSSHRPCPGRGGNGQPGGRWGGRGGDGGGCGGGRGGRGGDGGGSGSGGGGGGGGDRGDGGDATNRGVTHVVVEKEFSSNKNKNKEKLTKAVVANGTTPKAHVSPSNFKEPHQDDTNYDNLHIHDDNRKTQNKENQNELGRENFPNQHHQKKNEDDNGEWDDYSRGGDGYHSTNGPNGGWNDGPKDGKGPSGGGPHGPSNGLWNGGPHGPGHGPWNGGRHGLGHGPWNGGPHGFGGGPWGGGGGGRNRGSGRGGGGGSSGICIGFCPGVGSGGGGGGGGRH